MEGRGRWRAFLSTLQGGYFEGYALWLLENDPPESLESQVMINTVSIRICTESESCLKVKIEDVERTLRAYLLATDPEVAEGKQLALEVKPTIYIYMYTT